MWGNGKGIKKSYKKDKNLYMKKIEDNIEKSVETVTKLEQFIRNNETKKDYMEENSFINGFKKKNGREVVNNRLSERTLFSDGAKNPFMIDNDFCKDFDNANQYIKFGKK